MRINDVKPGMTIHLNGAEFYVVAVRSATRPDQLALEVRSGENTMNVVRNRDEKLDGPPEGVNVDLIPEEITDLFQQQLMKQLDKGYRTYGKNSISPKVDPLQYALEELIDAIVYIYVAMVRRERGE